jgi:hypothetical protein
MFSIKQKTKKLLLPLAILTVVGILPFTAGGLKSQQVAQAADSFAFSRLPTGPYNQATADYFCNNSSYYDHLKYVGEFTYVLRSSVSGRQTPTYNITHIWAHLANRQCMVNTRW